MTMLLMVMVMHLFWSEHNPILYLGNSLVHTSRLEFTTLYVSYRLFQYDRKKDSNVNRYIWQPFWRYTGMNGIPPDTIPIDNGQYLPPNYTVWCIEIGPVWKFTLLNLRGCRLWRIIFFTRHQLSQVFIKVLIWLWVYELCAL